MIQIFQIYCKKDQANSHMNKGLYNEKLINFIIKNILILTLYLDGSFRWVLCSSLSKFSTVQKYFKFSTVQISKSPNPLLLFTDYSTIHSPQFTVLRLLAFSLSKLSKQQCQTTRRDGNQFLLRFQPISNP